MELNLRVLKVLDPIGGTKKDGSAWVKHSFVGVLLPEGQYEKKVVLSVLGEDRWKQMGIVSGGTYQVSFDIDAHEWNGKWFNDLSAWRAVRTDGNAQAEAPKQAAPAPAPRAQGGDDIPF